MVIVIGTNIFTETCRVSSCVGSGLAVISRVAHVCCFRQTSSCCALVRDISLCDYDVQLSKFTVLVPGNQRRPRCCVPIHISIYMKQPHWTRGREMCVSGSAGWRSGPFNPANVHTTTENNKLFDGWVWMQQKWQPFTVAVWTDGSWRGRGRLEIVTGDRDRWEMEGGWQRVGKQNKIEKSAKRGWGGIKDYLWCCWGQKLQLNVFNVRPWARTYDSSIYLGTLCLIVFYKKNRHDVLRNTTRLWSGADW